MSAQLQALQAAPNSSKAPADGDLQLDGVVAALRRARHDWREQQLRPREPGGRELPSAQALGTIVEGLRGALFPMRLGPPDLRHDGEDFFVGHTLHTQLHALRAQILLELRYVDRHSGRAGPGKPEADLEHLASALTREFGQKLAPIRRLLDSDVMAAFDGDPAARSVDEVLLCYPGITAMIHHRLAHALYGLGVPLLARIVAELAHASTGIDIHPGARIGAGLFIDHGTGVVIGETAVIGERVRIYQAVTLGARSFPVDAEGHVQKGLPRHPVVEDEVVIYAGATILGRITIGRGATIGGNVWVTRSVPAGSHISQANSQSESQA
ncbi:serine O-acetyltransferase [Paucibacter sp. TC2R-5]|uniref:serine O-acetyltransferase EpsC n=1 Tax=Paucibacter sp. TC2R-5 TaxID=2893555 RepID=UPI0021E367AA|nr:serine O-acetyltransferase EpsC [Paucibacter sp. TC2R-5]MCV2361238.1 serine O-acetyltransferase [Paucibacter sp. TC2R-5]